MAATASARLITSVSSGITPFRATAPKAVKLRGSCASSTVSREVSQMLLRSADRIASSRMVPRAAPRTTVTSVSQAGFSAPPACAIASTRRRPEGGTS